MKIDSIMIKSPKKALAAAVATYSVGSCVAFAPSSFTKGTMKS